MTLRDRRPNVEEPRTRWALLVVGALAVFLLVGWGIGALVTSTLTASDFDVVRDVASDRTAVATIVAHVFSWIGSGFVVFPAAVVCCVLLYRQGRRASALAVALSTVGVQIIIDLDKLLVGRHRPPVHHLDRVTGHSFPSGHTGQTAALCTVLVIELFARQGPRKRLYAAVAASAVLIACVGFSRVYLGVHYPSDVIAGAIFGICWSVVASRLALMWSPDDQRSEIPPGRPRETPDHRAATQDHRAATRPSRGHGRDHLRSESP
jgi:undecaprenyl-diphosphatase